MLLAKSPNRSARAALVALDLDPPTPQISGRVMQFVYPTTRRDRRTLDFDRCSASPARCARCA
jgi:hypothetical protein